MCIVHAGTGSKLSTLLEEKCVYSPSRAVSQVAELSPMLVCLKTRHTNEPWDLENAEERGKWQEPFVFLTERRDGRGEYLHLSRRSLLQWIWGMTLTLAVWGLALGRTEQWTVA